MNSRISSINNIYACDENTHTLDKNCVPETCIYFFLAIIHILVRITIIHQCCFGRFDKAARQILNSHKRAHTHQSIQFVQVESINYMTNNHIFFYISLCLNCHRREKKKINAKQETKYWMKLNVIQIFKNEKITDKNSLPDFERRLLFLLLPFSLSFFSFSFVLACFVLCPLPSFAS